MSRKKQRIDPLVTGIDGGGGGGGLFSLVDDDTRLKIFHYLTWQDLASAAPTSKAFRDDCNHPSLTQSQDRQLTVRFHRNITYLCRKLVELQDAGKFDNCSRLKVVWHGSRLTRSSHSALTNTMGNCVLVRVTDVEVSFEPSVDEHLDDVVEAALRRRLQQQQQQQQQQEGNNNDDDDSAQVQLWIMVGAFVPNLRRLTVSPSSSHGSGSDGTTPVKNDMISPHAPHYVLFGQYCALATLSLLPPSSSSASPWLRDGGYRQRRPPFESLVFRDQSSSTHLMSDDRMMTLGPLRHIDVDDCVFDLSKAKRLNLLEQMLGEIDSDGDSINDDAARSSTTNGGCILGPYVNSLERVSIRNARYYTDNSTSDDGSARRTLRILPHRRRQRRRLYGSPTNVQVLPQAALIKFVRRATNLRWFRSDLTVNNVAMLQRERPDVTFVS